MSEENKRFSSGVTGLGEKVNEISSLMRRVNNYGTVEAVNIYLDKEDQESDIQIIKSKIVRLIPFEESLNNLIHLRSISGKRNIQERKLISELSVRGRKGDNGQRTSFETEASFRFIFGGFKVKTQSIPKEATEQKEQESLRDSLKKISEIELELEYKSENTDKKDTLDKYKLISEIKDSVSVKINNLSALFNQLIYSITYQSKLLGNLGEKIGHKEYNDEANTHVTIVSELEKKVDVEKITDKDFDILSKEAIGYLGILTEIETRRITIEKLLDLDLGQKRKTTSVVMGYVIIAFFSLWYFDQITEYLPRNHAFYSVVVWSVVGSFASMIYRFNKNPIHDFGNALKWLITRPIQGVVLGSALYLVLISGQYFFVGETQGFDKNQEIIFFIAFLIGFSDKFTENTLNVLIDKYSIGKEKEEE